MLEIDKKWKHSKILLLITSIFYMPLKNSVTTASVINSDEVNALDFDRALAWLGSWGFLPPSYYSANIVEQQIWWLEPISIDFKWSSYNASATSVWLIWDFVPTIIKNLPLNLGYIRSAAYSIAEACYQLSSWLNNDELKIIIAKNVVEFLKTELGRIQSYIDQSDVILHPTLSERFDIVTKILNAEIWNINEYVITHEVWAQVQSTKWSIESIHNATNDEKH